MMLYEKSGRRQIDLPEGWRAACTIFREGLARKRPLADLVDSALQTPLASAGLESLVKPGERIALVIDDITRPTPVRQILPVVLDRLRKRGVSDEDVAIVIGVGTHRPMTAEEIADRCGEEVASAFRVVNHDARSADLVHMGEAAGIGPVFMNALVAEADVRITIGSILPHPHNGFGGGPKSVMPGICDFETIRRHHMGYVADPGSILGNMKENPFYEGCCRIAALARIDFAVNCLYDSLGEVYEVVAGSPAAVHREGIERTINSLGVDVPTLADVTIVSSYPYYEGPQVVKPTLPAAMVTKPGGTILLVAGVSAPLPEFFLDSLSRLKSCGTGNGGPLAWIRERLSRCEQLMDGPMDFNMALLLIVFVAAKYKVVLVADPSLKQTARMMGFSHAVDLEAALSEEQRSRPAASVNLIPAGGYVFPMIRDPFRLIGTLSSDPSAASDVFGE